MRVADKKQILLVVRWPVGGIRTFLRYVYRGFDTAQWRFTIIAPDLDEMRVLINEDLADLNVKYLPVEKNPSPLTFTTAISTALRRAKYDLIHSHGFTSGACTVLPAKLFRIKHLMTSHDVINANQFSGTKGFLKKAVLGVMFGNIDKIHSVSHDAQANFFEFFPRLSRRSDKYVVIPNGIEVERFLNAEPRDLRNELGLPDDTFLIGFFGRFMSQKGFCYLVDAIDLLSKREDLTKKPLVLTFGSGGFAEREKRDIKARGLESHFYHMPFTANVAGSMKGLDVVAMPSLWEACGLLAMEALVCGVPFIGSNCIGLREFTKDTPALIVPVKDAVSLSERLQFVMCNDVTIDFESFSLEAARRFDASKQSQEVMELYCQMVINGNS